MKVIIALPMRDVPLYTTIGTLGVLNVKEIARKYCDCIACRKVLKT